MKRLQALVKLHRWQLDEKRRHVAELGALAQRLAGQIEAVDRDLADERRVYDGGMATHAGFAAFAATAGARRRNLQASLDTVRMQIADAEEEVSNGYRNLKKFELALDARRQRALDVRAHREALALDELALQGFARSERAERAG